jgi:hypothetical protein
MAEGCAQLVARPQRIHESAHPRSRVLVFRDKKDDRRRIGRELALGFCQVIVA